MNHGTGTASTTTRRQLLRTAAIGGTAAAAATLLSSSSALAAPAPASGSQYVKGVDVLPDTSHAARALAAHIRGYYQAKTDRNLNWQTSYFSQKQFTYIDGLFSTDAVYEDVPAHIQITSRSSIQAYLTKAAVILPYAGHGTGVRHVLGSDSGGGYEWTVASGPVPRGITALELDPWGKIERFTATWNGAYAGDSLLTEFAAKAIEY